MIPADRSLRALQRFGLGPRSGDLARVQGDPVGALAAEIDARAVVLSQPGLLSTADAINAFEDYQAARRERQAAEAKADDNAMSNLGQGAKNRGQRPSEPGDPRAILWGEIAARYEAAQKADCGFAERLVWFWSNHFAVSAAKSGQLRATAGAFEREAIRPHVFGRFADMLLAVEQHPSMLMFLDNFQSVGPNSTAGTRRGRGLNENLAREILELHTLGVDGGYKQNDVIALAKVITGWTVGQKRDAGRGIFVFNRNYHEPGAQKVLMRIYGQHGIEQGEAALGDLARHPATARHIAVKLVRHFVADDPPPDLVADIERTFVETDGDLARVSRALIEAPAAWDTPMTKLRTPQEFLAGMLRATDIELESQQLVRLLTTLGQAPWTPGGPDGFPDTAAAWMSPSGMRGRLDVASFVARRAEATSDPETVVGEVLGSNVSRETRLAVERADSRAQGLAILFASPEFQRR